MIVPLFNRDPRPIRHTETMTTTEPAAESEPNRSAGVVKSAHRTIQILEYLADNPTGVTLTELQRELSIPKSSLHGLLHTLVESGWLETDRRGTVYSVGLRALRIGATFLERDPIVEAAGKLLAEVCGRLHETVHLARLDGSDVVYLVSQESTHHLRTTSRTGRRLPAYATALGKALLATRTPDQVEELLPETLVAITTETVTDRGMLREELMLTRERGWSFEIGQNTPGLGCLAVAVPGRHPAVDAVSCSIPLVRLTEEHKVELIDALTRVADDLGHIARRTGA